MLKDLGPLCLWVLRSPCGNNCYRSLILSQELRERITLDFQLGGEPYVREEVVLISPACWLGHFSSLLEPPCGGHPRPQKQWHP